MDADFRGGIDEIDTRTQILLNHQTVKHPGEHRFPNRPSGISAN
jgi:hypothetical protein